MNPNEQREPKPKIWLVGPKEPLKKFSILNSPALTFYNKEDWFEERKKEVVEKKVSRIFRP